MVKRTMVGMSDLQAVFWDMDGTLVDTEPYWIQSEYELVAEHGGTWSDEQAHQLVGQALEFSASILQKAGVALETEDLVNTLMARVIDKCRQEIPWRPGARELLADLHENGVRSAMVTMSWKPLAEAIAEALPEGHLEFLVTGDMVTRGKPDPEAYHLAFETMAADHTERTGTPLSRARCLAVEDSVPGTAAAAASGMVTLAVPHVTAIAADGPWHLKDTLAGLNTADLNELLVREPSAAPA